MAEVIRLVCPECDAVHRVKSVTLGKLYRCKKCRSGLITMQPAILACPNCGATTPPAHIEVSKLITCDECEKAPLMEVRIPGVKYPVHGLSKESEKIATQMSAPEENEEELQLPVQLDEVEKQEQEFSDSAAGIEGTGETVEKDTDIIDENEIFKSDTNFIIKEKIKSKGQATLQEEGLRTSTRQLEVFSDDAQDSVEENVVSGTVDRSEEEAHSLPPDIVEPLYSESEIGSAAEEVVEEINSEQDYYEQDYQLENVTVAENDVIRQELDNSGEKIIEDAESGNKSVRKKGWSVPAWIPVAFALLLLGLYGLLLAELQTLKEQLAISQDTVIKQSNNYQQERVRFMTILREERNEKRELEKEVNDLRDENGELRSKNLLFDGPEFNE